MRVLLATVLILGGVLLLGACTSEEEADEDPTGTAKASATAKASPTAAATKTATATPAGAGASATPGRDFVRRPTLPTHTPAATAVAVQTAVAPPPVVQTAAPPPVVTVAPTTPPIQTPAPLPPSWETWVPTDPVTPGTMVELSIRNANGAPGETYSIGMNVVLPDQTYVTQEGVVSGADWLTFYFGDTMQVGFYDVYFGLPQSDLIYAQDYFEVAGETLTGPSWQTSAPREAVAMGDTVELGLRNEFGSPGECYDFTVEVYDPDGYYSSGNDTVCADQWTYLTYSDTWTSGYYDISYYIGDLFIASDYFQVGY